MRPGAHRRGPDPLALPPRPPDRRLRRHHPAVPRRVSTSLRSLPHPRRRSATACRRSGRPTAAPGSPGLTRRPPGPASSGRCPAIFAEMVRILAPARGSAHQRHRARDGRRRARACSARSTCPPDRVVLHENPTNDAWCRDHGPIFVQRTGDGPARGGHRGLGLQRLGREVPALRPRRRRSRPASARAYGLPVVRIPAS